MPEPRRERLARSRGWATAPAPRSALEVVTELIGEDFVRTGMSVVAPLHQSGHPDERLARQRIEGVGLDARSVVEGEHDRVLLEAVWTHDALHSAGSAGLAWWVLTVRDGKVTEIHACQAAAKVHSVARVPAWRAQMQRETRNTRAPRSPSDAKQQRWVSLLPARA